MQVQLMCGNRLLMHRSISVWKHYIDKGIYPVCYLCGHLITSIYDLSQDHIEPLAKGGKTNAHNLMPVHKICNHRKGCMTVEEFRSKDVS